MKKITAMLLCMIVVFALAGCGAEKSSENQITDLFNQGYETTATSCDESSWSGIFQKDGSWDSVFLATAAMTPEKYEEFTAIEFDDAAALKDFLGQITDVTVTDITDRVPGQDELDAYAGMTIGELESAGFERTGYVGDSETGYEFFLDGPEYCFTVTVEGGETMGDIDNYSENDIRALKVSGAEFSGFSGGILER